MKAITLWQPWASLLACGAKKYETRGWETRYRGPIAIHAAKKGFAPYACELPIGFTDAAISVFWPGVFDLCTVVDSWDELPRGAIVATAELVCCRAIYKNRYDGVTHILDDTDAGICIEGNELLFGDWTPGRYAWEFANVKMLDEPIPAKGKQGLWNWEEKGL